MSESFGDYAIAGVILIAHSLAILTGLLISTAILIYAERKIWAAVHWRRGPNVVGPWGILQPLADFLKFLFKEPIIPAGANKAIFVLGPLVSVALAMAPWAVIPVQEGWAVADINLGIFYVLAVSTLGVYGIIMAGWASNSKYPFLSALRAAAQMVSYEVSIGFVIIAVLLCAGSLNLSQIVLSQQNGIGQAIGLPHSFLDWNWLLLFPMLVVFFVSALAETNRPPFDLAEAESELVAGYTVEYGSSLFLLQFLSELVAVLTMSGLTVLLFLGGWLPIIDVAPFNYVPGVVWFLVKLWAVVFLFSMTKAIVPRYRYDQLMRLGWKVFLPISLFYVFATATILRILESA